MPRSNIVLLSSWEVKTEVGKRIAGIFDMMFLDTRELILYEYTSVHNRQPTREQYLELQTETLERICGYEGAVISLTAEMESGVRRLRELKKSAYLVYLYERFNQKTADLADIVIEINGLNFDGIADAVVSEFCRLFP